MTLKGTLLNCRLKRSIFFYYTGPVAFEYSEFIEDLPPFVGCGGWWRVGLVKIK